MVVRCRWGWLRLRVALVVPLALGAGACGGGGGKTDLSSPLGDNAISSIQVVATLNAAIGPVDAAPNPDGTVFYFTVNGASGPAVQQVAATGGRTTSLVSGSPLVRPVGVAVATDGSRVFVADPGAGRIFSLPAAGGTPVVVAGSESRAPRGLDVAVGGAGDVVYFTGTDPADGAPGVFSIPAAGGAVTTVAKGAPLVAPEGLVVAVNGTVYVTDRGAAANGGAVFKVTGPSVVKVSDTKLGDPGGVSLTSDGKTLLVSSQNAASGADQVLLVDLATGKSGTINKVIGANHDSAGGLHRAYRSARFAWADTRRGGQVYRVDP